MIEIKGIYDSFSVHAAINAGPSMKRTREEESAGVSSASGTTGVDSVRISPEGVFRAKLDTAMKACVQESRAVPQERLEQLKVSYQGDQCPISARDTANALMQRVCGAGRVEVLFGAESGRE